jgi:RNA polymerase sigma-70 factor (ECF subfamily)
MDAMTDAEDWALVLGGHGEAFGRIFDRHKEPVRRQVRRLLDRSADVEDAVAVVFLEAWRKRASVRVVQGSLLPWLLVTANNVARNSRRSRLRYEALLARLPQPPSTRDPASVLDGEGVVAALRRLSLADQQVLTLCVLEGWSERDAAAALGVAPGTVKSRLHRAKQRLAERLGRPVAGIAERGITDGA